MKNNQFRMSVIAFSVMGILSGQATAQTITSADNSLTDIANVIVSGNSDSSNNPSEGVLITSNSGSDTYSQNQAYLEVLTSGTATLAGSTSVNINTSGTASTTIGGAYAGDTNIINGSSTLVVNDSGTAITGTLSSTGSGTLGTTGVTTNTLGNANAGTSTVITSNGGSITQNDAGTAVLGTTTINASGTANTTLGNATGTAGNVSLISGGSSVTTSRTQSNTTIAGQSVNSGTVVANGLQTDTLGVTGTVAIGGATTIGNTLAVDSNGTTANASGTGVLNVTNGNAVNLGVAAGAATMGGNFAATAMQASMTAGNGSYGVTTYTTPQVVGTDYTLVAGNTASRTLVNGASVNNIIQGNTLVDGNMYINGTLTYSSNTSATTTVTGSNTVAGLSVVNAGQTGYTVDANGKINTTKAATNEATAALTVTNSQGNTHGIVVSESATTISGGQHSTSLTLNDNGARFSNSATGAPVTVTGVADGQQDFDAVNYRQLKQIAAGVAGVSAMANIPQVDQNKTFAVGVGLGNFQSQTALALGASYRVAPNAVIKASASTTNAERKTTVYGVGAGFSW